jgi:protein-disulfide isomerase
MNRADGFLRRTASYGGATPRNTESMTSKFRAGLLLGAFLLLVSGCSRGPDEEVEPAGPPPQLDMAGMGYSTGLDDAPVTVIEFSDFGCPFCAQFALDTYPQLHTEFVLSGRVRWIYVPFVIGRFPNGGAAALAGECAGEQSRFWAMHDQLFLHQSEWRRDGSPDELLFELAGTIGLDRDRFQECYAQNRPGSRIETHNALARRVGVRGTPSFLVNGRPVEGALPIDQFRTVLEYAVATAQQGG